MTFKELLNSVRFEDVAPHIVRMDADAEHNLGWYKIHFDMLRQMTPVFHEDGFIFDVNPSLGNQVLICYAAYNSTNTLID